MAALIHNWIAFAVALLPLACEGSRVEQHEHMKLEEHEAGGEECCCRVHDLSTWRLGADETKKSGSAKVVKVERIAPPAPSTTYPTHISQTTIKVTAEIEWEWSTHEHAHNSKAFKTEFTLEPEFFEDHKVGTTFNSFKMLPSSGKWAVFQDNCIKQPNGCKTLSRRSKDDMLKCEASDMVVPMIEDGV
eukprot:gnl/TRDRNA2_/TRDRNA2_189216_c0_seq1.p1 gnl/TRDRNA2_/TRDRNA2_189216_c0~~gnl/TRDRNA2_/TRDRNA2_189216_c0_seq1.p1  ORF type:complete len:189 (+),score=30.32 gnl/TRDRNA2_/TRDRNA2_189216_c0_seq1:62-628(+)